MPKWKKVIRILVASSLLVATVYVGYLVYTNKNHEYHLDKSKFAVDQNCEITVSEHIIACGLEAEDAERLYAFVWQMLGLRPVPVKIELYKIKPNSFGAIGYLGGAPINGLYRPGKVFNDVIMYNGNVYVLIHEFAHYFFEHSNFSQRTEMFAQAIENLVMLRDTQTTLVALYRKLASDKLGIYKKDDIHV